MIEANPPVREMAPYTLADLSAPEGQKIAQLAQNESFRPPSPSVVTAVAQASLEGALYPDPDWSELRRAIGLTHDLDPAQILCGAGSMDLIKSIAQTYAGPERPVYSTEYGYAFFQTAAALANAPYFAAPESNRQVDVDAVLDLVNTPTGIVFLANPGNPTGTVIPNAELRRLRAGLPHGVLLVIDEAYAEFADGVNNFDLCDEGNTIILRTFSKAYGLAAARVGWGVFPQATAPEVRKTLNPNNLPTLSQAAATAAMRDQSYMRETCRLTRDTGNWLRGRLVELGVQADRSFTNFLLLRFDDEKSCIAATKALWQQGVLARGMAGYGLGQALRLTIGTQDEMELVFRTLKNFFGKGGAE